MSSNVTGNPAGIVAPMVTPPTPNVVPVITIPSDGDAASAASVAPAPQQLVNHVAYLMQQAVWNATYPTAAGILPQMRFKDAAGNGRYLIDHNGLPTGGRIRVHREFWETPVAAPTSGQISGSNYTVALAAGSVLTVMDPTATFNSRFIRLTPATASGNETYLYGPSLCISNTSFMSLVMEFEVGMNAALAGVASNASLFCGLSTSTDPYAGAFINNGVALYKKFNVANWFMQGTTTNSTSTAPTVGANPVDRVRIEIQGSASPGGIYQATFYINEVLIGTLPAVSMPGAVLLRPSLAIINDGGAAAGSPLGYVGPVTVCWNSFASGPNL